MTAFDFLVHVDRSSSMSLREQLYRMLREAILDGRLPGRARLPSTRVVAQQTGLARQTVVEAFEQLIAEGYAIPRQASGTYVAETLPDDLLEAKPKRKPTGPRSRPVSKWRRCRVTTLVRHHPAAGSCLASAHSTPA